MSKMRVEAIKNSYKDEESTIKKEANELCEIMLFGVFEEHLKKIGQIMLLNTETIHRVKETYLKYYPANKKVLECYFLLVLKKMQRLSLKNVIYMLFDRSYNLSMK